MSGESTSPRVGVDRFPRPVTLTDLADHCQVQYIDIVLETLK